ncbi:MAG: polysaccharide deacetylase family protein [Clostridia bacterium]|jgi:polysaccharide deacetylase family sporulation protein PdaB|nr:polysaccharide deacetylase family protein [Clostridia bacterium]MDD4275556.1 polysaccharide deacetylase family protein [Clostridia bacterium]
MPFVVVKSRLLKFAFIVLITAVMLCVSINGTRAASVFFGYAPKNHAIYAVDRSNNEISLTFDAAWGADKTIAIVDLLKKYNIKATFFLVGFWVEKYPEETKYIVDSGMEIASHSNSHPDMTKLSVDDIKLELNTAKKTIKDTANVDVSLFRPPFGYYNDKLLSIATDLGYKTIKWSVDTHDWMGKSVEYIANRVTSKISSGGIILFHNNSKNVIEATTVVIESLLVKGYKFVTIGELVYADNYYIDRTGLQRKNV